jgi:hypothetical protein
MTKSPNALAEVRTPRPHNSYGTHKNSIPFLQRDLAAAYFTSLSLLNRHNVHAHEVYAYQMHTP